MDVDVHWYMDVMSGKDTLGPVVVFLGLFSRDVVIFNLICMFSLLSLCQFVLGC